MGKRKSTNDSAKRGGSWKKLCFGNTTNGGLWRYVVGDTIQFTCLHPFRIKVSGRLKHYINAFGEEIIIDNTDKAIALACKHTDAIVKDYTAAPVYFSEKSNGAHEWL